MYDKNGAECYQIRPGLKAIDTGFDVAFDYDSESYIVLFNGFPFRIRSHIQQKTTEQIRKAFWVNLNGDPIKDMDTHNERVQLEHDKQREDMTRELAKDLRWAIRREF